jgi:hypothetical protein
MGGGRYIFLDNVREYESSTATLENTLNFFIGMFFVFLLWNHVFFLLHTQYNFNVGENPDARGRLFNGDIDDLTFWNYPLSPGMMRVVMLFFSTLSRVGHITNFLLKAPHKAMSLICPVPPRLCHNRVAQYTFDEGNLFDDNTLSPGVAVDGAAQFTTSAKFNIALTLPGDRHVSIPNRSRFDFTRRGN